MNTENAEKDFDYATLRKEYTMEVLKTSGVSREGLASASLVLDKKCDNTFLEWIVNSGYMDARKNIIFENIASKMRDYFFRHESVDILREDLINAGMDKQWCLEFFSKKCDYMLMISY